jgi:hypothetical protein
MRFIPVQAASFLEARVDAPSFFLLSDTSDVVVAEVAVVDADGEACLPWGAGFCTV